MTLKTLGVDYGRRKIGLAMAEGVLAEPWKVIRVENFDEAVEKVGEVIKIEKIEKVVVGVSEGEMGKESESFSLRLGEILGIPVETFDETLSTQDAQRRAIEAGIGRKKRKALEDAFAAALMLQSYLDIYV